MNLPVTDRDTTPWVAPSEIPAAKAALSAWRALRRDRAAARAAALREALGILEKLDYAIPYVYQNRSPQNEIARLIRVAENKVRKALAAPARNCDRFDEYHDAVDAWHREERCLGRHMDGGTCDKDLLAPTLAPVCFARWLFAPAAGESK